MTEIVRSKYTTIVNDDSRGQSLNTSKERTRIFSLSLTKVEKIVLSITMVIMIVLVAVNLIFQSNLHKIEHAIQNYESQRLNLQAQTDRFYNEMSEQYNYQSIKQVAGENGMTIDSSRVRSIE